jgi:DHA1 family inner membrane transport protein
VIALSPLLADVAADLGVSTATAGQLRTISGLAAGVTALALGPAARRLGLRGLLLVGTLLLALGSLASAAAPSFVALALAQLAIGVSGGLLVTAGTAAAADWVAPEHRPRALSWALAGPAGAWLAGMPLIGFVAELNWRFVWLALPLGAALVSGLVVLLQPGSKPYPREGVGIREVLADRKVARWALGELLAISAWVGTLVYVGALFVESYGSSLVLTGIVLATAGGAYMAGNLFFRRFVSGAPRALLIKLALVLAGCVIVLGAVRPSLVVSAVVLYVAAFVAGGRTLLGSAFDLDAGPERRLALMGVRAGATQFGYFVGAAFAGAALSVGGYDMYGLVLGMLFVAATLPHLTRNACPASGAASAYVSTKPSYPCAATSSHFSR